MSTPMSSDRHLEELAATCDRLRVERDAARAERVHEINRANVWRLAADTWQQRAVAAEARVATASDLAELSATALTEAADAIRAHAHADSDNWAPYTTAEAIVRARAVGVSGSAGSSSGNPGSAGSSSGASDAAPNEPHVHQWTSLPVGEYECRICGLLTSPVPDEPVAAPNPEDKQA